MPSNEDNLDIIPLPPLIWDDLLKKLRRSVRSGVIIRETMTVAEFPRNALAQPSNSQKINMRL